MVLSETKLRRDPQYRHPVKARRGHASGLTCRERAGSAQDSSGHLERGGPSDVTDCAARHGARGLATYPPAAALAHNITLIRFATLRLNPLGGGSNSSSRSWVSIHSVSPGSIRKSMNPFNASHPVTVTITSPSITMLR